MLEVTGLTAGYGAVTVLREAALSAKPGEVHCLLGRNGAGKSTLLKAVMGLVQVQSGRVRLGGTDLTALPAHRVPQQGVGYVPQGRRLFTGLSVDENLQVGLRVRSRGSAVRARMLDLFPILAERLRQPAGTLSGGEQQQLAMARALCLEPQVLLLDEPTEGLQPSMIALIRDTVRRLRDDGVATVLVEQRVDAVLDIADRVTFIENGRTQASLTVADARAQPALIARTIGLGP